MFMEKAFLSEFSGFDAISTDFFRIDVTSGLATAMEFLEKVRAVVKTEGITVVITTHILTEAETLCDRIGLLDNGKIVLIGSLPTLMDTISETVIEVKVSSPSPFLSRKLKDEIFFEYQGTYMIEQMNDALLDEIREFCRLKGIQIDSMVLRHANLEDVFIKHTGRKL